MMRIASVAFCLVTIGSLNLGSAHRAAAQGTGFELGGVLYEQPSYFWINEDSLINPDNEILEFSEWTNRLYGRIGLNLNSDMVKFVSQFRPTLFSQEGESDTEVIVDDAYLDLNFGGRYFLYAGKRNLRNVVAYGFNPTDFLGEGKEVDFTKREEERRIEREGNYMVGMDAFFENITLSAVYAPKMDDFQEEEDRTLFRGSLFAEAISTDMALHLYYGDIPGVGFDLSTTIGDHLVLHTESAFRWGSEKDEISLVSEGDSNNPRTYEISDPDDDDEVYPHLVFGGSLTFGDGTNLIAEYIYNGDGYTDDEWDEFIDFVEYSTDNFRKGLFTEQVRGNLGQANDIINFREIRKHYAFFRLSNSTWIPKTDGQLVLLLNAEDSSFLFFPSVDFQAGTNTVLSVSSSIYNGDDDTEFGMIFFDSEITFVIKYYF